MYGDHKYRRLPDIRQDNQDNYLDLSSNDYLSMSSNEEVLESGIEAARKYGFGATGSRLLSGNNELFQNLENLIAKDKHTESALIFSTGFQANTSVLASLLDEKVFLANPIVFFDKLNHSSLYQAVFSTKAELIRYNHNDMIQLEYLMDKYKHDTRPKFIVAETIFGMDGDILPIEDVVTLAKQHHAFLYLDEAHATGIFGPSGYGLSTTIDLSEIEHVIMGSFSKALGCSGGYIACSEILQNYLINKSAGFIYSTAPSPAVMGAVYKSWDMLRYLNDQRCNLLNLGNYLREKLLKHDFDIGKSTTHIVPIILKKDEIVLKAKETLLKHKIIVSAIRPPTVPPNSSRLRIALNTKHRNEDVDRLIEILVNIR